MEIWIDDKEIIGRIQSRVSELSDDESVVYYNSDISMLLDNIFKGNAPLTHDIVIRFCIQTNTSYKYIVLGKNPVYDMDDSNRLYQRLIKKNDFTI